MNRTVCMIRAALLACLISAGVGGVTLAADSDHLPLPGAEPDNWLAAGRDFHDTRFSPLQQITEANVARLGLAWSYDLDTHRGQEATSVVVDGVLYTTTAWSKVLAFNAATGARLWQFDPHVPGQTGFRACCDVVNRGVAVWNHRVYVAALDGRLFALDARSGKPLWSRQTVDPARPYTITGAPLVADGRVVIGNAGGEYGVRGYVSAYDAVTGKRIWHFYTVPGDPAKGFETPELAAAAKTWSGTWWIDGGSATVWNSFSYDPKLDLLYFGTGNASPWGRDNKPRTGPDGKDHDSLYATSIVAVHLKTGRYAWHFQVVPGDHWDYDATQNLILATLPIKGTDREVLMQASKNGFFYVLDRRTGEFLSASNFVPVNWTTGLDPKTGRPAVTPAAKYYESGTEWINQPGTLGGHNWQPMAFSPQTGLVYIPAQENPDSFVRDPNFQIRPGRWNLGLDPTTTAAPRDPKAMQSSLAGLKGYLIAWDPAAQREVWRAQQKGPWNGGVLATAGNLVFAGTASGELAAYRASDGQSLWSFATQTGVLAAPMTYSVDGRQYVSVLVGWGGSYPLYAGPLAFKSGHQVNRSRLLTFALDAHGALPPLDPEPARTVRASNAPVDRTQADRGATAYARTCSVCHGDAAIGGGVLPDLRYSAALGNDAFWRAVVNDGALTSQGMIGFKTALGAAEISDIRAYLTLEAQRAPAAGH